MNRLNDPDLWRNYQDLLADDLEELLRDPDSDEEWIEATLNLLWLVEEIIEELEPPH
jgi:hypothetical protein